MEQFNVYYIVRSSAYKSNVEMQLSIKTKRLATISRGENLMLAWIIGKVYVSVQRTLFRNDGTKLTYTPQKWTQ